jgi:hypothetical protein
LPTVTTGTDMTSLTSSTSSTGGNEGIAGTQPDGKRETVTLQANTVNLNIRDANFRNGSVELTGEGYGWGHDFSPNTATA